MEHMEKDITLPVSSKKGCKMEKVIHVNGNAYEIIRLLGRGKSGYSYLACSQGVWVVLKQIHHEPCSFYHFGNKIESEKYAYRRLKKAGIRIPAMLAVDDDSEIIIKEYIDGPTIFELVRDGISVEPLIIQIREMAELARMAGINLDYFSPNFVVRDHLIYYVDYEANEYSEEWNFENWGIKYWSRTPEFEHYLANYAPKQFPVCRADS